MQVPGLRRARALQRLKKSLGGATPPNFPSLRLRILERLRDPSIDFDEVADAIRWDAGLTVKLLQTVNSALYAPKREIQDVRHAISYLGRSQLESVVLAMTAASVVPSSSAPGFDRGRFWSTAALRAGLARALAARIHPATESEAFTAALLLDVAVPLMVSTLGDRYSEALIAWHESPETDLVDLERQFVKTTHCEVGGLLAEAWELPSGLATAIQTHHDPHGGRVVPEEGAILPAVSLVACLREVSPEAAIASLVERAHAEFGLEPEWVNEAIEQCQAGTAELASMLAA